MWSEISFCCIEATLSSRREHSHLYNSFRPPSKSLPSLLRMHLSLARNSIYWSTDRVSFSSISSGSASTTPSTSFAAISRTRLSRVSFSVKSSYLSAHNTISIQARVNVSRFSVASLSVLSTVDVIKIPLSSFIVLTPCFRQCSKQP